MSCLSPKFLVLMNISPVSSRHNLLSPQRSIISGGDQSATWSQVDCNSPFQPRGKADVVLLGLIHILTGIFHPCLLYLCKGSQTTWFLFTRSCTMDPNTERPTFCQRSDTRPLNNVQRSGFLTHHVLQKLPVDFTVTLHLLSQLRGWPPLRLLCCPSRHRTHWIKSYHTDSVSLKR